VPTLLYTGANGQSFSVIQYPGKAKPEAYWVSVWKRKDFCPEVFKFEISEESIGFSFVSPSRYKNEIKSNSISSVEPFS